MSACSGPAVEQVDLVDADDRVIGTVPKPATDGDPSLIHREIAVLIHRRGELLMQLRSAAKTVMPLTWDVACAGHVAAGEAPESAAHRELREELGVDLTLVPVERRLVHQPTETYFAYVFTGAARDELAPVIDASEVAALAWCDQAGLRRWRSEGRRISPVASELADAFWSGRWRLGAPLTPLPPKV